jgi:phosphopantetheinyl transferase
MNRLPEPVYVKFLFTEHLQEDAIRAAVRELSTAERSRHDRFVFARDRRDYAMAHAMLRRLLSQHGQRAPNEWTFSADANGKPCLAVPGHLDESLVFNLSHTAGLVACAVGRKVAIGIDVERLDHAERTVDLSDRFFADREAKAIRQLASDERRLRFIETWTLKEAFVKAIGEGLSCPLDSFDFVFDGELLRFQCARPTRWRSWRFALFAPSPDYRMAIAIGADATEFDVRVTEDLSGLESTGTLVPLRVGVSHALLAGRNDDGWH